MNAPELVALFIKKGSVLHRCSSDEVVKTVKENHQFFVFAANDVSYASQKTEAIHMR